jgi:hypothetical protein
MRQEDCSLRKRVGRSLIVLESGQYATEAKPGGGIVFVHSNPSLRNAKERFPVAVRFQGSRLKK